jgi:hypothetical protein
MEPSGFKDPFLLKARINTSNLISNKSLDIILFKKCFTIFGGSRTLDHSKVKPGLVRKGIIFSGSGVLQQGKKDVFTNSDQPRGKTKKSSILHLTSTE